MASLDRIRTEGFKRWYERQLAESHLWLVTWLLAVIVLACGLELAGTGAATLFTAVALTVCGLLVAIVAWSRYRSLLLVAERLAEQAVCPNCQTYARFSVRAARSGGLPEDDDARLVRREREHWYRARCRACRCEWDVG